MKQNKQRLTKIPSPEALLAKADQLADGFNLGDYRPVMFKLREKGMTFRAIAAWLSTELERTITHTQVFRLLQVDEEIDPQHAAAEHNNRLSLELREENEIEGGGGKP